MDSRAPLRAATAPRSDRAPSFTSTHRRRARALRLLVAFTLLSGLVALPVSSQTPSPTAVEVRMTQLVNAERARHGLPAVRVDVRLVAGARGWSGQMARDGRLSHDPNQRGGVPPGATAWAENVARVSGGDNGDRLHSLLMSSQPHRANILDRRYTDLGIGIALSGSYTYATQRFTGGAPARVSPAVEPIAAAAERAFAGGAGQAVIARDDEFPDALAAGPLAGLGGPMLLTPPGPVVHPSVRLALERTVPAGGTVWIVGGTAAVSGGVEHELRAAGWTVRRVAGADRVHTAAAVARVVRGSRGGGTVLLATAGDWPDAAAGGAFGAATSSPVLLTDPAELSAATAAALRDLRPARVVGLGGPSVLSDHVLAQAGAARVAGPTRQGTAAAVAQQLWGRTSAANSPAWTVTTADDGLGWPYALTAAPIAARTNAPVLLAGPTITDDLRDYLRSLGYGGDRSAALATHGPVDGQALAELRALTGN